jgi:hypothetical protein
MPRQLNIRSDRAAELARDLSARHGKPIALIVEEALEAYADEAAAKETPEERLERWLKLLEEDWKHLNRSEFKIDDLYDPETGLPA